MTEREKHISEKKKGLTKLSKQQMRLIVKAVKIAAKPSKRGSTALRRAGQVLAIAYRIRSIEMQKQMIIAQPIPSFIPGGVVSGRSAIVGESGPEQILITNGAITVPPHKHIDSDKL